MTKKELVAEIILLGGGASSQGRKLELQQQLQSLREENGVYGGPPVTLSDYQVLTREMNKASIKKSELVISPGPHRRTEPDYGPAPEAGPPEDLRPFQDGSNRSCGIRQARQPQLRGGICTAGELLRVGQDDGQGGLQQSSPSTPSPLVGASTLDTPYSQGREEHAQEQQDQERGHCRRGFEFGIQGHGGSPRLGGSSSELAARGEDDQGRERHESSSPPATSRRNQCQRPELRAGACGGSEALNLEFHEGLATSPEEEAGQPSCKVKTLDMYAAQHLESQARSLVPQLFQSLQGMGRLALMEVCCEPDSLLSTAVQKAAGLESAATRCSLFNACDMGTSRGVKLVLERIQVEKPQHVWMSPPCGPYSPIQNLNQRSGEQFERLQQKRLEARRIYVGCSIVFHYCVPEGIHVTWEMSERCLAWRLPLLHQLKRRYELYESVTQGCAVNLREKPKGRFLKKGWRIVTTHARLAKALHLPCRCPKEYIHARCEGSQTKKTGLYTPEYVKRAAKYILEELDFEEVQQESRGHTRLCEGFGIGRACVCPELQIPNLPTVACACCQLESGSIASEVQGQASGSGVEECVGAPDLSPGLGIQASQFRSLGLEEVKLEQQAKSLSEQQDIREEACLALLEAYWMCSGKGRLDIGVHRQALGVCISEETQRLPCLSLYLNQYLKKKLPEGKDAARWTSMSLQREPESLMLRKWEAQPGTSVWHLGIGAPTQHALRVREQRPEQSQLSPDKADVDFRDDEPQRLDSHKQAQATGSHVWFCYDPSPGRKASLCAYMVQGWESCSEEGVKLACSLGFSGVDEIEEALAIQGGQVWKHKQAFKI